MFQNKKAIIFDMDGTLIDSIDIWNEVDKALIRSLGFTDELNNQQIQKQRDELLRKYSKEENPYLAYCTELKERYHSELTGYEIWQRRYKNAQEYLKTKVDYKPNVEKFLKLLKGNGFVLAIASSTRKPNMAIYQTENQNIIKKANIDDYFSLIYTKENVKESKPNPEIYLKVVEDLGVQKQDCLIFEDALVGVEAGKNAGIEVVAIYDEHSDSDREKINQLADYQVKDYLEAIEILEGEILNEKHIHRIPKMHNLQKSQKMVRRKQN